MSKVQAVEVRLDESLLKNRLKDRKMNYPKKNTIASQMMSWFIKEASGGRLVTHDKIVKELSMILKPGSVITRQTLSSYVNCIREILEEKKGKTLWNVPGEGWKLATEKQKAVVLVRSVRTTIRHADRARRLLVCTDKKEIPYGVDKVFGSKAMAREQAQAFNTTARQLFGRGLLMLGEVK